MSNLLAIIIATLALTVFKGWLLFIVLGWFGITSLTLWQAVVTVILVDLLLTQVRD